MKIYIVFAGLLTLCLVGLTYQGEMGRYIYDMELLKQTAEEAAAGAALCLDWESYGRGQLVFQEDEAFKYVEKQIEYQRRNSKTLSRGRVSFQVELEDDKRGYSRYNREENPAVRVDIQVEVDEYFSLPFFSVNTLRRSSRYEQARSEFL